ncbi:Espin [Acropora cervicornis]|uniref:Espin n=1 Tax=Acropora cervicornis TaxID=6130 RepID=A0AAD9PZ96_ACRCE|nr:Espin [Acropora cervicornis]
MADTREQKQLQRLKDLHAKGRFSPNNLDQTGLCHIHHATLPQEGHVACLEWLAKYSGTAYWELPRDGMTAVHAAAVEGHLECLAFLLRSAGCRVFVRDRTGNTPLHYAAACGRRHCVEWFLSNTNRMGNERNKLGSSPLHLAALNGHLEVVKLLVRGGVAIKLRDRMGRTPFNVAESSGNEACAQFLEQLEVNNLGMYNRVGTPNLKRVRFERKAIERDSEGVQAHHSGQFERGIASTHGEPFPQKPYSLYRNRADNLVALQRPGNATLEEAMERVSRRRDTQLDNSLRHTNTVPQRHAKSHVTSTSLLPWSRVYKMTQFTEAIPSSPQTNVYSLSNRDGREKVSSISSRRLILLFAGREIFLKQKHKR